jgi:hypothetical protein
VSARRTRPRRCTRLRDALRDPYPCDMNMNRTHRMDAYRVSRRRSYRRRSYDDHAAWIFHAWIGQPREDETKREREREREREILEYRHIVPRRRRRNQRSQGTGRAIQQRDARVYRPEIHVQRSSARSLKPRASISIKRNKRQKNKAFVSRYPRAIEGVGAAL